MAPPIDPSRRPHPVRIYLPFAFAYFLSYSLRTVNAVVSPELTRELQLGPAALGLLTSAYFLAFCAVQLPNGILLDRYGPRRTEAALLLFTAVGCALFAFGESLTALAIARGLIGLGVSAGLMASLKAISLWFERERQASLSNWIMVAGALGAVSTTIPLEQAIAHFSWRYIFAGASVATVLASAYIYFTVPDPPAAASTATLAQQWQGVVRIFKSPRLWWMLPMSSLPMGCYMAIQSLWAVPWMMEVEGLSRAQAANRLFVMAVMQLIGYFALSVGARHLNRMGIQSLQLYAAGYALYLLGFLGLVVQAPIGYFPLWLMMALGTTVNVMGFQVFAEGIPKELFGRASTAINQVLFALCFGLQWGIGAMVEFSMTAGGMTKAGAFVTTFAVLTGAQIAAYIWFLAGWKKFSKVTIQ